MLKHNIMLEHKVCYSVQCLLYVYLFTRSMFNMYFFYYILLLLVR